MKSIRTNPTDGASEGDERPRCVPLCGASKAYGRYDKPWLHEAQCPVRIAWNITRNQSAATSGGKP